MIRISEDWSNSPMGQMQEVVQHSYQTFEVKLKKNHKASATASVV
jgi:hypothetical protein